MSRQVSINKLEGSILPSGVTLEIDKNTHKMRPRKILKNAKPFDDFIWHNTKYKIRIDISDFCKDQYEANIRRVIILYKGQYYTQYNEELDTIVTIDVNGKLFNHRNGIIIVDYNPNEELLDKIRQFRINHPDDPTQKLYLVTSENANYTREKYEMDRSYEWFEEKCIGRLALWETDRQNVETMPELYKREWVIGKKELKRQHKKFFQPEGKSVKIGQLWKHQPWTGRPFYNLMYMDQFKIYDSETHKVIFESLHDGWGPIVMAVRRYMKDHAFEYYNTDRYAICAGRVRKTQEWIDIVRYDTMNNLYLNVECFIAPYKWQSRIMNEEDRKRRNHLPYDKNKLNKFNLTKAMLNECTDDITPLYLKQRQINKEDFELMNDIVEFYDNANDDLQDIHNKISE